MKSVGWFFYYPNFIILFFIEILSFLSTEFGKFLFGQRKFSINDEIINDVNIKGSFWLFWSLKLFQEQKIARGFLLKLHKRLLKSRSSQKPEFKETLRLKIHFHLTIPIPGVQKNIKSKLSVSMMKLFQ